MFEGIRAPVGWRGVCDGWMGEVELVCFIQLIFFSGLQLPSYSIFFLFELKCKKEMDER